MDLSILICTLKEREHLLKRLRGVLDPQVSNYPGRVEILEHSDNREMAIGAKRNLLISKAAGNFVCFVDDDDLVSENYVKLIVDGISNNQVDCVGITGRITENGANPHPFIHSIRYKTYSYKNGVYYRPPNHLNPIKKSIAIRFPYREINYGEDSDFAIRLCESGLLKSEYFISETIYYYLYNVRPVDKPKQAPVLKTTGLRNVPKITPKKPSVVTTRHVRAALKPRGPRSPIGTVQRSSPAVCMPKKAAVKSNLIRRVKRIP